MTFKLTVGLLALSLALPLAIIDGVEAGMATRYWDCCKPSASWGKKAPVYAPVDICKADGVTLIESSTADSGQSGCNGGDQYMCNCMQPFNDNTDPTLAYGFAAFTAGNEEATDCACYLAEFAHDGSGKAMKRNKLLFQVTNTGGDVNSGNIDFQIPGGGLGAFTQGCPAQWKTPASQWGETYGGVKAADQCSGLPKELQEGCKWRFSEWGDNPVLSGAPKRVRCPKALIDRSGCQRKDDNAIGAYQGKTDAGGKPAESGYKRNRSVCLGGASSSSSSSSSSGSQPEGYGAGSNGNAPQGNAPQGNSPQGNAPQGDAPQGNATPGSDIPPPSGNGDAQNAPADQGAPAPAPEGYGNSPNAPAAGAAGAAGAANGAQRHKRHKQHKKPQAAEQCDAPN
ncbi:endoglucanase 1 precursor [Moesziomyces antarcticus]|uniref:Cellulase n=2 Tax=Pseudozyma antarctica TaxID=84753 RepID=A0A081CMC6_PSEA2|nr:endoglucanase 1 precursor [Moesziomyces antarcticus]GAK67822.1 endoglucanase 1 precursor [Moesziomyces antarcticus]SPO48935.1 related to endoglucanase 1 precursor (egl1) [Moesziomyces antarcticus]